jgi:Beta-lactamase.
MPTNAQVVKAADAFARVAEERGFAMDGLVVDVEGADLVERLWSPDERRDVYSVSKTFTSVAIGLAVAEKRFDSTT